MQGIRAKILIAAAASLLLPATVAFGQEKVGTAAQKPPEEQSSTSAKKKPALTDSARVDTNAALRDAVKQQATKGDPKDGKENPADSAVVEMRPADANASSSGDPVVVSKKSKKGPLKDVHGKVYGATNSNNLGTRGGGGAVGASSKSGKTSVYVETEGSRTTPPR
jgi:hypothetical protein